MAFRNLRTSLITPERGFGGVASRREAITPFGRGPIGDFSKPNTPFASTGNTLPGTASPMPQILPPSPNVFSNNATTPSPAPQAPAPVLSTGAPLGTELGAFNFGNPFHGETEQSESSGAGGDDFGGEGDDSGED